MADLLSGWHAEPVPLLAAIAAVVVYERGAASLAARGSPAAPGNRQRGLLWAGVALILVALLSPVDSGALRLQWVHMVQHVLLLVVAPPLIVLARPWIVGVEAFHGRLRSALAAPQSLLSTHRLRLTVSFAAAMLFVGVLWLWHVPGLYDLTLRNDAVHNAEHTAFLATGLAFWAAVLPATDELPSLGLLGRSVLTVAGLAGSWVLAVYIGYSPVVLYAYHGSGGLSALSDQQTAAGVMWVPASLPFIAVLVMLGARWFENDARAAAAEAAQPGKVHA